MLAAYRNEVLVDSMRIICLCNASGALSSHDHGGPLFSYFEVVLLPMPVFLLQPCIGPNSNIQVSEVLAGLV